MSHEHDDQHDNEHGNEHGHRHHDRHDDRHGHTSIRLAVPGSGGRVMHRLDRRRFLADLGRNTIAVALVGGFAAACSGDDDAASSTDAPSDSAATGAPPTAAPATAAPSTTASNPDAGPTTTPTTTPSTTPSTSPSTTDGVGGSTSVPGSDVLRWEQADFGFVSAYVLVRGTTAAVIDTGTSGNADRIGETLALLGVTFDDVRHVVLTHHHPDHIGSLPEVLRRAGSAATYAGEADIPTIGADGIMAVGDGDDVFGLQVIATPGHTPGSISLFDPGIGLLVAGDALNGNDDGTAISGPNAQFTADMTTAEASVAKLRALDVRVAAFGHGQPVRNDVGALMQALAG